MRRRRPMNVQVFEDIDGTRVEIDQREVHAARVERHDDGKVIVIEHGEEALTRLGIGARPLVETWLGRTLDLRLSDAEVWAHPKAEEIYAFISGADYGTWNRVARQMTREQWTEGVRQVLEGIEMHRCESCERKPLQ